MCPGTTSTASSAPLPKRFHSESICANASSAALCVISLPAELTLVMIEHDIDVLRGVVDSAAVLHLGSLVTQGTMRDIQNDERVRELYLGGAGASAPAILALEDSSPPGASPPEEAIPPPEASPPEVRPPGTGPPGDKP